MGTQTEDFRVAVYTKGFSGRSNVACTTWSSWTNSYWDISTQQVGEWSNATADWSRPKPPVTTPTLMTITREWYNGATFTTYGSIGRVYVGTQFYCYPSIPLSSKTDGSTDAQVNEAIQKAKSKFTGDWVDLGEVIPGLKDTVDIVAKAAGRVRREMSRLSTSGSAVPDVASSRFLEFKFGVLPALQDAHDAAEALYKRMRKGQNVAKRSGGVRRRGSYDPLTPPPEADGHARSSASVGGTVGNPSLATFNALGLINPALAMWQFLKWSFVVDWFIDISAILASISWHVGLDNLWGCTVTSSVRVSWQEGVNGNQPAYVWIYAVRRPMDVELLSFSPTARVRCGINSGNRVLLALALGVQHANRVPKRP